MVGREGGHGLEAVLLGEGGFDEAVGDHAAELGEGFFGGALKGAEMTGENEMAFLGGFA